ncbi:MAG TPA: RNA polymerase factor sigma-54, partial [Chloroflexia bacterium]|nr:RNA polymerase factor sigma-54 [Chloroflexia bacterium]
LIQEQSARVSPTLIAVNHVLALSSQELQNLIKQEAEENPAFDIVEHHTCTICGEVLKNGVCLNCIRNTSATSTPQASNPDDFGYGSTSYRDEEVDSPSYSPMGDDDDFDPVSLVAAEATMHERLLLDLRSALDTYEYDIAEYILGNLDNKGFLSVSVDIIANELDAPMEQVERVLGVVQRLGPPGIAARDPRECLLLQLEQMEQDAEGIPPHVRDILESYFIELGEHKYGQIAQKLGISLEEVEESREYIRNNLTPYPVIWAEDDVQTWGKVSRAQYVSPDVMIREVDGRLEVEVSESRRFFMRLNPLYSQMASDLRTKSSAISDDDKRHIQQYVSRTKLFISNIKQRRETLTKIANALVEYQEDFLRNGVRHLRPLTRAQIAEVTGLHESTVSRATAGKYIMLPNRQVVPFSDFFTASLSVKDVIKEIIEQEGKPMADREIVARLKDRGIRIARRTVAKYRSQLRILPSTLR